MTKYVVAILVFVAALAGLLLYIGDDVRMVITSTAQAGPLSFSPIDMTWQAVIVISTLGIIGILGLWTFLGWLRRLPSRLKSGVGLRRRNQALDAMEEALIAGAEGNTDRARKKAEKARSLISSPALGRIVSAQAAEASGDTIEAITHYEAMLDDDKTQSIGQRGLAQQLFATGDLAGAIEHAGAAYTANKTARWAFDMLFQAQVADHRWRDAGDTLELANSRKHIDKDISRRRRAVLMTAEASRLDKAGDIIGAEDLAVTAAQDVPQFAPGVALAASLLTRKGDTKKAAGLIEKAWGETPHPALVIAMRDIVKDEPVKTRKKRMDALVKANPDHRETTILKAEEALLAGDGVTAWSVLSPIMQIGAPTTRLCLLAAEAETMLQNPADASVWTECAATAASEPDWSDLDPEGTAFDYTDQDWRRLVFSFGESGDLIHPRFESGAATRAVARGKAKETKEPDVVTEDKAPLRQPDDPGPDGISAEDDLAKRLDSLLDDPPSKSG